MSKCPNVPMITNNYMRIILLSLLSIIFSSTKTIAQRNQVVQPGGKQMSIESVNELVKALMDSNHVAGLCLGIINDNQPAYIQAYGYKNREKNEMNDTATCFYGASLAKPLFAYIVMHLVDDKLIELDKPLYTYLPKPIPEYEGYHDLASDIRWKLITARNCLDHTTGFPNWRWIMPVGC
jgi:CubicO group peptidase (beta-lactamase class C family)